MLAQKSAGTIVEFTPAGAPLNTIQMPAGSQPSALYYDASSGQLMVGDEGPDMNIKLYNISGTPTLTGTFGIQGGYLDATQGIKGQVGDKRFTRIVGIGKDSAGNLYGSAPNGGTHQSAGVVYELKRLSGSWHETVLYDFCAAASCADGGAPYSARDF